MQNQEKITSHWDEQWRKCEPPSATKQCDYYISNYGRIKSIQKATKIERLLRGSKSKRGDITISIKMVTNKYHGVYIHKFVASHFVDKTNEQQEFVVHIDKRKENNHWSNLKWVTREELTAWLINRGVYDPTNRPNRKHYRMTESKVILLKRRLREGKMKKKVLAKTFGITPMQLNRIERGENWGHVTIDDD